MDNRCVALFRVGADSAPNLHNISTGRIDDCSTAFFDLLDVAGGSSKCGDDDDVIFSELVVLFIHFLPREGDDIHVFELSVDLLVVNDFTDQVDIILRKNLSSCIG